jgi:hypothetical protein
MLMMMMLTMTMTMTMTMTLLNALALCGHAHTGGTGGAASDRCAMRCQRAPRTKVGASVFYAAVLAGICLCAARSYRENNGEMETSVAARAHAQWYRRYSELAEGKREAVRAWRVEKEEIEARRRARAAAAVAAMESGAAPAPRMARASEWTMTTTLVDACWRLLTMMMMMMVVVVVMRWRSLGSLMADGCGGVLLCLWGRVCVSKSDGGAYACMLSAADEASRRANAAKLAQWREGRRQAAAERSRREAEAEEAERSKRRLLAREREARREQLLRQKVPPPLFSLSFSFFRRRSFFFLAAVAATAVTLPALCSLSSARPGTPLAR